MFIISSCIRGKKVLLSCRSYHLTKGFFLIPTDNLLVWIDGTTIVLEGARGVKRTLSFDDASSMRKALSEIHAVMNTDLDKIGKCEAASSTEATKAADATITGNDSDSDSESSDIDIPLNKLTLREDPRLLYENILPREGPAGKGVKDFTSSLYKKVNSAVFCKTDERHVKQVCRVVVEVNADEKLAKNTITHDLVSRVHAMGSTVANALPLCDLDTFVSVSSEFKVHARLTRNGRAVALRGIIDYLGVDPKTGRLVVIDYKTAQASKYVNSACMVVPDIVQVRLYAVMVRKMFKLEYTPKCYLLKFALTAELTRNTRTKTRAIGLWKIRGTNKITTLEEAINVPLVGQ